MSLVCVTKYIIQDRLDQFRKVIREFRFVLDLLRHGRAHDPQPDRIKVTRQGALALKCPACPHPGINLSPDILLSPS